MKQPAGKPRHRGGVCGRHAYHRLVAREGKSGTRGLLAGRGSGRRCGGGRSGPADITSKHAASPAKTTPSTRQSSAARHLGARNRRQRRRKGSAACPHSPFPESSRSSSEATQSPQAAPSRNLTPSTNRRFPPECSRSAPLARPAPMRPGRDCSRLSSSSAWDLRSRDFH